jgi:hypothetical protein
VSSFDDLEVGMVAIVGAKELGNGQLKAVWVGAGKFSGDRPHERPGDGPEGPHEGRPFRAPESGAPAEGDV